MPEGSGRSPAVPALIVAAVAAGAGAGVLIGRAPSLPATAAPAVFSAFSPLLVALVVVGSPGIVFAAILIGQSRAAGLTLVKPILVLAVVALLVVVGSVAVSNRAADIPGLFGNPASYGPGGGTSGSCVVECTHNQTGNGTLGGGGNASGGSHNGSGNSTKGGNGTGNSSQGGGSGGGNTTRGSGGGTGNSSNGSGPSSTRVLAEWKLPVWAQYVVLGLVGAGGLALVVPVLVSRARRARTLVEPSGPTRAQSEAQAALRAAAEQLRRTFDAREVVVALYLKLLGEVAPLVGDIGPQTAGEIRDAHLLRLGVRRETAVLLTHLFEEARYSSHPIDVAMTRRALDAIRAAEADLVSGERRW